MTNLKSSQYNVSLSSVSRSNKLIKHEERGSRNLQLIVCQSEALLITWACEWNMTRVYAGTVLWDRARHLQNLTLTPGASEWRGSVGHAAAV